MNIKEHKHVIRAYGRSIAKAIEELVKKKDVLSQEEIQAEAELIVKAMAIIAGKGKISKEIEIRAWQHFLQLSDFQLNVNVPYELPRRNYSLIPDKVPIVRKKQKTFYLGEHIPEIVTKIAEIKDTEEQKVLLKHLLKMMMTLYQQQNKANPIPEALFEQIKKLYPGKLNITLEEIRPENSTNQNRRRKNNGRKKHNYKKKFYKRNK